MINTLRMNWNSCHRLRIWNSKSGNIDLLTYNIFKTKEDCHKYRLDASTIASPIKTLYGRYLTYICYSSLEKIFKWPFFRKTISSALSQDFWLYLYYGDTSLQIGYIKSLWTYSSDISFKIFFLRACHSRQSFHCTAGNACTCILHSSNKKTFLFFSRTAERLQFLYLWPGGHSITLFLSTVIVLLPPAYIFVESWQEYSLLVSLDHSRSSLAPHKCILFSQSRHIFVKFLKALLYIFVCAMSWAIRLWFQLAASKLFFTSAAAKTLLSL